MPALAIRMSTSPACSRRRSISVGELRSTVSVRAWSSSASGSSTSARRPGRISSPPQSLSARANAWPRPPVAPVISTVDPDICTCTERTSTKGHRVHRQPGAVRGNTAPMPDARPPRPELVAVFGPTGVGKTAIAVALSERLRARGEDPVAVSADALQVYAGLEILTGVASPAQRSNLEPRLISFLPLDATFSAGQYAELAHAEIDDLLAAGRRPIVVGGTGLYLRAALAELDLRPPPPEGAREHWTAELQKHGAPALHALLAREAAWAAAGIDPHDRQRVVRALELLDAGELEPLEEPSQLWSADLRHPTLLAGLTMDREELYALIDARVEEMLAAGVREEVRRA